MTSNPCDNCGYREEGCDGTGPPKMGTHYPLCILPPSSRIIVQGEGETEPKHGTRVMSQDEVDSVNQLLKTDFPLRVIYEERRYIVPGGLLIELLTEIAHLKEKLDLCEEGIT